MPEILSSFFFGAKRIQTGRMSTGSKPVVSILFLLCLAFVFSRSSFGIEKGGRRDIGLEEG